MVEIFDDIRKVYDFYKPSDELSSYIEFISESSAVATREHVGSDVFSVKMFSSWTPTFWINLGPPYEIIMDNLRHQVNLGEDVLVIRDAITERINQPDDHIFTVKFFPGALDLFFGIKQSALAGQVIDLSRVLPLKLLQKIRSARHFEYRVHLLEAYLLNLLQKNKQQDHYINFVNQTIALYQHGNMRYNVGETASRAFLSSKTINRYFKRVIGTSPKNYLSVIRARTALTCYVNHREIFEPEQYGYYDASHFHKEVNKFTGQRLVNHAR